LKKRKKEEEEEEEGWRGHLFGRFGVAESPNGRKKNLFNGFWLEPPSRAKPFKKNLECLSHLKGQTL
jgi:hypothetical protein